MGYGRDCAARKRDRPKDDIAHYIHKGWFKKIFVKIKKERKKKVRGLYMEGVLLENFHLLFFNMWWLFFSLATIFGRVFEESFPACVLFFFKVEIS